MDAQYDYCDIVFRKVRVCDGSGTDSYIADVAVRDDRIYAIGELGSIGAREYIDASAKVLAPGFVDIHSHDDRYLLDDPAVPAKVSQGVTTVVVGNCGLSLAPYRKKNLPSNPLNLLINSKEPLFPSVEKYIERLRKEPASVNSLILVGHSTLRANCMNDYDRVATDVEIDCMQAILHESLAAGAIGMSSGVFYGPAQAATEDELVEVGQPMGELNGIYATHIRDESDAVMDGIVEAAAVAARIGVRLVLSHHKVAGVKNFGRSKDTLALIETLSKRQPVSLDIYPYAASSTILLESEIEISERVLITSSDKHPEYNGRYLSDIARELKLDELETARKISPAGAVYFQMHETDVRRILSHQNTMIGSDGSPWDKHPHPRFWGTFPRVLGYYAREQRLFSLEEAIYRMTGLPAGTLGLRDRGLIKPGFFADLVLLDPRTVSAGNSFEKPQQPARGIELVMANGTMTWKNGQTTGERPGYPIRIQDTDR